MSYNVNEEIRVIRQGQAIKAQGIIPPGVVGHNPGFHALAAALVGSPDLLVLDEPTWPTPCSIAMAIRKAPMAGAPCPTARR